LELRELELAETICPFGEYAKTLRMKYLGNVIQASFTGSKGAKESAKQIAEFLFNV